MNSKVSKIFASLFATVIILSAIPIRAQPLPPAIWPEPTNINFNTGTNNIGDKFNVTLWIATTAAIYTWQVRVQFNTAVIKADRAGYTAGSTSAFFAGHGTVPVVPVIDNSTATGFVVHGESLVGSDSRPAGTGTLFWIEFEAVAAPPPGGSISTTIDTNNGDTFMLDPDLNSITCNKGASTFTFTWTPPPAPRLVVDPATKFYDRYTHAIGAIFTEDIIVYGLSAGWYLKNVTTHMTYNATLLQINSVVFNPIWTTTSWSDTPGNPNDLLFFAETGAVPSGNVVIATITFEVLIQGSSPPLPIGYADVSPLTLHDYSLYSSYNFAIGTGPKTDGLVTVESYQVLIPAHLEVSSFDIGPGPSRGKEFNITVSIHDLHFAWNMIGIQFRLCYDETKIVPTAVYEGDFLPYWAAQEPGSMGTFFIAFPEEPPPPNQHVLVGNMIFPDMNGIWHAPMPDGSGVICTITFKLLYQSFGDPDYTTTLHIFEQLAVGLDNLVDQNIVTVPLNPPVDGYVHVTTDLPGREIDVYGHAVNSGYGPIDWQHYLQFPPPYGGQGPDAPMDMVEPQSWITMNTNVTYNYWPVQHKLVGFEVTKPDGSMYTKLFAFTDENGVATVGYRMPWPCDNPESLFGVWRVTSTVQLADEIITDHLDYHYDYMVHVWKVTTDKYEYDHDECIEVTVQYGSHAQQEYPALFVVSLVDELGVTVSWVTYATTLGGTVFCQYKNGEFVVRLCMPKWAYAGIGEVRVNAFDKEPVDGGVPLFPTVSVPVAIQPY